VAVAASSSKGESSLRRKDLRVPAECDRVFAAALERFTGLHILVNNAGLTFTTIDPARFRRAEPQKFWQVPDDIARAVIETNYIAADQMARRVAPVMVEHGWGREADTVNGWRFDANLWDPSLPPAEAARRGGRPDGFELHAQPA
jgi:NAD(P)-dependent dehydrogenase (short-subunit alcohol dehydrogenase family)